MLFQQGQRIVFIGDSITDCGRKSDPEGIGNGYVRVVRDYLSIGLPAVSLQVENRGISGETILDLKARWQEDVIALNPDWLSVSIGINDDWKEVSLTQYRDTYRELLTETKKQTAASLILMETTIISENPNDGKNERLLPYNQIIREMAEKFSAILVPQYQVFTQYLRTQQGKVLTYDQVHMNSTGNLLMALNWLDACGIRNEPLPRSS
ncbi:lipase [Paenibacillus baekrokdamisoli]|uniref:Lipase n=1 Tax=Paenibacillus baekrokdamisoli TaxID=1712516 RepID=A0A3G9JHB4_9BACL|nr:SGNH/GDSL hydrolase family protein [Paenibacillus baekrokdamisoli]MBB3072549.1 lysophospholipase L1-like esterase [Paenibacillus baekrokdamisoli]BBH22399.1 lipase [Paenibacillus baekrokdamisoli]